MPWNNTPTTEQRQKFVTLANSGRFSVSELCLEFGVSRKCGHKWLVHHAEGGAQALADGSRAPHNVPLRTSDLMVWVMNPLSFLHLYPDETGRITARGRISAREFRRQNSGGSPSSGGASLGLQASLSSLIFDLLRSSRRLHHHPR